MSDIRLERVDDWSTVKPGDPVRLTRGTLQVNGVVAEASIYGAWLVIDELSGDAFSENAGWVLERPVLPEPLPTVPGSVIEVHMLDFVQSRLTLELTADGHWAWEGTSNLISTAWHPEALSELILSWSWVRKPESLVVEETRNRILNDVLTVFDGYPVDSLPDETLGGLRNAVAAAIAKAGS